MAYLTISRIAGDTHRLVDRYRMSSDVMAEVGRDHGVILHAAAQTADGLLMVNVWPSRDGSESAAADPRRLAALARGGVRGDELRKEHYELEALLLGA